MKNTNKFGVFFFNFILIGMAALLPVALITGCTGPEDTNSNPIVRSGNTVTYVSNQDGGTLTVKLGPVTIGTGQIVPQGTDLTVIAAPASGYQFDKFTIDGTDYSGNTTIAYTMPDHSVNIAVFFIKLDPNQYKINFIVNPTGAGYFTGTASDDPITIMTGGRLVPSTFKVVTDPKYELTRVTSQLASGGTETNVPVSGDVYSFTQSAANDIIITAYFYKLPAISNITLTAVPDADGAITADTDLTGVAEGTAVNITATPAAGGVYGFVKFQVANTDVVPESVTDNGDGTCTFTLTMPDTDTEVKAFFGINVTINYYEGKIGKQAVIEGQSFQKPSNPLQGLHTFTNWYNAAAGGSVVTFPFTVTAAGAPYTIYAQWTLMDLNRDHYTIYVNDLVPYTDGYNLRINYQQFQSNATASGSRILMFLNPRDVATSASQRILEINPWGGGLKTDAFYSDLAPLPAGVTATDILPPDVVGTTGYRGDSYSVQQNYAGPDPDKPRNEILASDLDNVMVFDIMNTGAWGGSWSYLGSGARDHEVNGITIIRVETWVPNN